MRTYAIVRPLRAVASAAILLGAGATVAGAQSGDSAAPGISATAVGEVKVAPDRAELLFSVETRAATADQASQQNATRQSAVLAALRSAGLAAADVGTVSYTLSPEMVYDEGTRTSRVVGYVARNTVRATVRDIARTGRVIDAAIGAGANEVSSLQFSTSRREELRLEAIRAAVQRACREASAMAAAGGGSLGPMVQAITADGPMHPPQPMPMMRLEAARMADTPVTPQDVSIEVTVSTRWSFFPARSAVPEGATPACR